MSNNGKSLTNVSFRAKMLAVIDKLKNQDKTALVRHVDDFEQLNKDTFEAAMNALVEAIPEGGGGGGGTGDGGYVVTFGLDFENESITCDKTIEDIIAHANKHIVGRFVVKDMPFGEDPSLGITVDLYCDNMKFDYQTVKSDNPEIVPMLADVQYLGFMSDSAVLLALSGEGVINNEGVDSYTEDSVYYKTFINIFYKFADDNPKWNISFNDISKKEEAISTNNISFAQDFTWELGNSLFRCVPQNTSGTNNATITYRGINHEWGIRNLMEDFTPALSSGFSPYGQRRTALFSPPQTDANSNMNCMFTKPAQVEVYVDLSYISGTSFEGIFTINKFRYYNEDENGIPTSGYIEMFMDEFDSTNSKIIRHIITLDIHRDPVNPVYIASYNQVKIDCVNAFN